MLRETPTDKYLDETIRAMQDELQAEASMADLSWAEVAVAYVLSKSVDNGVYRCLLVARQCGSDLA